MNNAIRYMLEYLGLSEGTPTVGCDECPEWPGLPRVKRLALLWMLYVLTGMWWLCGRGSFDVTSMIRCGPCNSRRGGVGGSRHLYGDPPGKPFAAVDVVPDEAMASSARAMAIDDPHGLCNKIRETTGWPGGIGLIIYASGRWHLDIRQADYVEVK